MPDLEVDHINSYKMKKKEKKLETRRRACDTLIYLLLLRRVGLLSNESSQTSSLCHTTRAPLVPCCITTTPS
jgi:hypothetical protein